MNETTNNEKPTEIADPVEELVMRLPNELKPGTEEYHLNGLHLAKVREFLGGIKAVDSGMFKNSIAGLLELGYSEDEVAKAVEAEFSA